MKFLFLFFVLLALPKQNNELKSTAEIIINNLKPNEEVNESVLEGLFPSNARVNHLKIDTLNFNIIHYRFLLKISRNERYVSLLTYLGRPLRASCFIDETIYDEPITEIETVYDSANYNLLNERYSEIHEMDIKLDDINPSMIEKDYLGYFCLNSIEMPELGRKMLQLTTDKNSEKLLEWAYSVYPEKKIYGLIGLQVVNYNPEVISAIRADLAKINYQINTCSGHFIESDITISKYLNSAEFNRLIENYKHN